MSIAENLATINSRIIAAAIRAGREPEAVRLVAVSKTQSGAAVRDALAAGHLLFGENYVQEFVEKVHQLPATIDWHFIGSLQSNKVKYLTGLTSLIHSVDRISLAREIDRQWARSGITCDILIQVNISGETTKSGTTATDLVQLVRDVAQLSHVKIKGLMTMPPFFDEPERARPYFRQLRVLAELINAQKIPGVAMEELSMGMSGDFEVAIEEGATLVRVGTAVFGERYYP
jgi:PLP dependent protein